MRVLIIILWLIVGFFYWYISKNCCDQNAGEETEAISELPAEPAKKISKLTPLRFSCSSDQPDTDPTWGQFRDSLVNHLGKDSILSIRGLHFKDENYSGPDNLGLARARNVLKLLTGLKEDRVQLSNESRNDSCKAEELNNLIVFRYLQQTKKIQEIEDRTIIYFAFNSTRQLNDKEVEKYLDAVAKRVANSAEKIQLTGHTDDIGSDTTNIALGEMRAEAIKNYLVRKGINPSNILVRSRGERSPIALNNTEEGRIKNRRVELQIIK